MQRLTSLLPSRVLARGDRREPAGGCAPAALTRNPLCVKITSCAYVGIHLPRALGKYTSPPAPPRQELLPLPIY